MFFLSPSSRSNASCTWRSLTASNELVASSSRSTFAEMEMTPRTGQFIMSSQKQALNSWGACMIEDDCDVLMWYAIVTIVGLQVSQFLMVLNDLPTSNSTCLLRMWGWISAQGFKLCNSRTAGSRKSARAIAMRCFLRFDQDSPSRIRNEIQSKFMTTFIEHENDSTTQITFPECTVFIWAFLNFAHKDTQSWPETLETTQHLGKNTPKTISSKKSPTGPTERTPKPE